MMNGHGLVYRQFKWIEWNHNTAKLSQFRDGLIFACFRTMEFVRIKYMRAYLTLNSSPKWLYYYNTNV